MNRRDFFKKSLVIAGSTLIGLKSNAFAQNIANERNYKLYEKIKNKYGNSCFIRKDLKVEKIPFSKYSYAMRIKSKLPKNVIGKNIKEIITLDGIKVILENDWWFLIRPSGTEPLVRIYAEAENEGSVKELIKFATELSII